MKNQFIRFISIALSSALILIAINCSDNNIITNNSPPDFPLENLLSSPDTIFIEGRAIYLATFMWRDFMPGNPPDGGMLNAIMIITANDTIQFPENVTSDAVWIIYNNQVWKSWLSDDASPPVFPNCMKKNAWYGPKWGPCDSCAIAVVRVKDPNSIEYFIKADYQGIGITSDFNLEQ